MDESRKAYEEWFAKEYEEVNNSTELSAKVIKMIALSSWLASRATFEIKLPTENELHQKICSGCASESLEMVEQAILAAGIKVKE